MQLVIVESPTKAKTISKFLPKTYRVESSYGHIRDLPQKEMGIDIEHDFLPKYVIPEKAKKQVSKLESLAQRSSSILFATDEDREGEAIAWHLKNILKPKNYERITFHEITKKAIENSLTHPRDIDIDLVNAQQARRILDRLVGYELSPFLWKKVAKGLSAGRVQSVAVRLVVEKEREIEKFKIDEYWTLEAIFNPEENNSATINAKLHAKNNKTLKKLEIKNEEQATELLEELKKQNYSVANIISKENKKKPPEPFRTSTLQQAANQKLGFSSKETMMLAQQLYEGIEIKGREQVGLITYMRTDSLNLSEDFLKTCKDYIDNNFGSQYAPKTIRRFKTKSKGAQEAHEAIRPTHIDFIPENIRASLSPKQFKLYDLIWRRTLACQMADALLEATTIDINTEDNVYTFRATGQTIKFDGFLKIYRTATEETLLPKVNEKEKMNLKELTPKQHFTQPPARYSEATLIKTLEEYGIGRPSTYAPTLMTIQDRKYVVKEEKKFKPTEMGFLVTDILVEHFPKIVDFKFTAEMEEDLDKIAEGKKEWTPIIRAFYTPFKKNLEQKSEKLSKKDMFEETTDEKCEKCGSPMVIKLGRYGKFLACSNYPECKNTKNISGQPGKEPAELELSDEKCELCGAPLAQKVGRYGKFLGCSKYPECKYIKKFSQKTGIDCPDCSKKLPEGAKKVGEIISRRGRSGKIFYGCSNYPSCKFVLWGKPTGEKCEKCGSLLVEGPKETIKCSNKNCK